jgi:hypothetical protein
MLSLRKSTSKCLKRRSDQPELVISADEVPHSTKPANFIRTNRNYRKDRSKGIAFTLSHKTDGHGVLAQLE